MKNIEANIVQKLLFYAFSFLVKQKNAESKNLKNKLKGELECNFIHSDEEDDINDDDDEEDFGNISKL